MKTLFLVCSAAVALMSTMMSASANLRQLQGGDFPSDPDWTETGANDGLPDFTDNEGNGLEFSDTAWPTSESNTIGFELPDAAANGLTSETLPVSTDATDGTTTLEQDTTNAPQTLLPGSGQGDVATIMVLLPASLAGSDSGSGSFMFVGMDDSKEGAGSESKGATEDTKTSAAGMLHTQSMCVISGILATATLLSLA